MTKKKGYVFLELNASEDPKKIANRILDKFLEKKKDYCCSVLGKYDVVIEKNIEELAEVNDHRQGHQEIDDVHRRAPAMTSNGACPDARDP
jgi:hypothetical protein